DTWAHVRAVEVAMLGDRQIFLLPRSGQGDEADAHTPGRIGLIATVEESRPSRRGGQRVIVRGAQRGILVEAVQSEPYLQVTCQPRPDPVEEGPEGQELMHQLLAVIETLVELNPDVPSDVLEFVRRIHEPGVLADHAAYSPEYTFEQRRRTLETLDPIERLRLACEFT